VDEPALVAAEPPQPALESGAETVLLVEDEPALQRSHQDCKGRTRIHGSRRWESSGRDYIVQEAPCTAAPVADRCHHARYGWTRPGQARAERKA